MNTNETRFISSLAGVLLLQLASATLFAQTTTSTTTVPATTSTTTVQTTTTPTTAVPVTTTTTTHPYLLEGGTNEVTLGAAGAVNQDWDDSNGLLNFSYGRYLNPSMLLVLRQSIGYDNPATNEDSAEWNGSTRVAFDFQFGAEAATKPYIGISFGGVYGANVSDTFAAGLETGLKKYVMPRTFVYLNLEYAWFFTQADKIDNSFDSGAFNWSVGVGYNF